MPDRYTGTPSRATAAASASAWPACTTAWLPITKSGRSDFARAFCAARSADSGARGVVTARARTGPGSWLPSNILRTCRFR